MGQELVLELSEDGADAERLQSLAQALRRELLQLDVDDVRVPAAGPAPDGSRAVELAAVGALLVGLSRSLDGLHAVVGAVRRWLAHGDGVQRAVTLQIDGDVLDLSGVSQQEQARLIELFVSRHSSPVEGGGR